MNVEALNQLKRVLQESIDGKLTSTFNMAVFCEDIYVCNGFCNTHACAAGSAALDPWFIERGFFATSNQVNYKGLTDFSACMEFFELEEDQCDTLFLPSFYRNSYRSVDSIKEQEVIDRIDFMLAENNP